MRNIVSSIDNQYGIIEIGHLLLENRQIIKNAVAKYERVGNPMGPTILVCHALTGNEKTVGSSDEPGWWRGLIGPNQYVDTNKYQVITFNVLGGCNGSTGPLSENPETGESYRTEFPYFTIRDIVNFQNKALQKLGIKKLKAVIGGSLGGMQALEWGFMYPELVDRIIALAVTPSFSDYAIAYNQIGIEAISSDPEWEEGYYPQGKALSGLKIARMAGIITYRSGLLFQERFNRKVHQMDPNKGRPFFEVESYMRYQGEKLAKRFDANSYLYLLHAMNSHDVGRGRGGFQTALNHFKLPLFLIGFKDDLLYKPEVMRESISYVEKGQFYYVDTKFGHDGFLVEFDKWGSVISDCLKIER